MSGLVGTGMLVRLALRRDRITLPVWVAVFVATAASSAAATIGLYPTVESRVRAAAGLNGSPALVALYGRVYDPTSLGAIAMLKLSGFGGVLVALLAVLTVVRHTRADEETGRRELLAGNVVGRLAPLAAALIVALVANLTLGLGTGIALAGAGLPVPGSFAFGLAWAGVGVVFAAVAAVAAQLTTGARGARGLAVGVIGVVYVLRAVGDTASGSASLLTWGSPIGWGQQVRPYAGDRWWVLLVTTGFALGVVAVAVTLVRARDVGAGMIPDRPGRASATSRLASPVALAWRLHRGVLLAWTAGMLITGPVLGSIVSNLGDFFDSPAAREMIVKLGGEKGLVDAFVAAEMGMVGIIVSAYGVSAVLRMRSEETGRRAEAVLAGATTRARWAGGHVGVVLVGSTLLMVIFGIGVGLAQAAQVGDAGEVGRALGAALVQLPAIWVPIGLTVAAFGLAPRLAGAGWMVLVGFLLLGELGPLLGLDQWLMNLSPYTHVPRLPGADWAAAPLVALAATAGVLTAIGLAAFARRDIG